jgi:chemotaxis protein MotB
MSAPATPPIIIIKKKGGHGGHHGGAWKVAYADFVTAMMALFIVLWLLSSSDDVKKAVAGYFRDPKGHGKMLGSAMGGSGESLTVSKNTMSALKDKLEQAMKQSPQFEKLKDYVQMTVTGEGLRIELLETEKGMFFATGQPVPTDTGRELLIKLSEELGKMKNSVLIEGHTDSKQYQQAQYSNWELSADRANSARKIMQENGLRADQVTQVRGFADQQLRIADKPEDPSNRRVSIIVQYPENPEPEPEPAKGGKEGKEGEGGGEGKSTEGEKKPEGKEAGAGKAAEGKPAETKTAEKLAETKPPEAKSSQGKPTETKPNESKPAAKPEAKK